MDESRGPAFNEAPIRISGAPDPRRLYAVIAVPVAVIVILIIRPWGEEGTRNAGPATSPRAEAAGPTAFTGASVDGLAGSGFPPALEDPLAATCASPSGWRAATLQQWAGRTLPIRSWIAIDPVPADGPLDPAIPFAPVSTGIVTALGYCAPMTQAQRPPPDATATLWAIIANQPVALTSVRMEPADPNPLGGLWRRPPEIPSGTPVASGLTTADDIWPPGRYVIRIARPDGRDAVWLGVEVEDLARPDESSSRGSPSPTAAIGPSPQTSP